MSKDNVKDEDIIRVLTKKKHHENGVIDTYRGSNKSKKSKPDSSDKDPAQIIKNLDDELDERNKEIIQKIMDEVSDADIVEIVKGHYVTPKKKKEIKDLNESNQSEFKELIESFEEARFEEGDNTIRNVCILSSISKNNRVYKESAMANVLALANGTKVYCDHSLEKGKIRSVRDLIGQLKNPHKVGNKIYADLQVLSNKVEFVMPLAKEMPHQVGMSIVAQGKIGGRDEKGRMQVEEVVSLRSCDIVVDPATVNSLFEQKIGVKKDGTIGKIRVGKKFDKNSPVCEFTHKVTCPVYSELNVNYEKCLLYKDGENCPYSEGGEFYRKTKEEISDEDFVNKVKE